MRRREFVTLVGGVAASWPLTARAQQTSMPVIGFLHLTSLETNRENLATFRQGLADTGYVEGKNVAIEYRWAQGRNDQLATLVAELVRKQVSVIAVLETTNGALAAKAATQTIPVVFLQAADPVRIGLVDSLNRPGGNVTGVALMGAETAGKRLELLLELVPKATSIGYLRKPDQSRLCRERNEGGRDCGACPWGAPGDRECKSPQRDRDSLCGACTAAPRRAPSKRRRFSSYLSRSNRCAGGPLCPTGHLPLRAVRGSRRSNKLWHEYP
jgi:hypothetical protein